MGYTLVPGLRSDTIWMQGCQLLGFLGRTIIDAPTVCVALNGMTTFFNVLTLDKLLFMMMMMLTTFTPG